MPVAAELKSDWIETDYVSSQIKGQLFFVHCAMLFCGINVATEGKAK